MLDHAVTERPKEAPRSFAKRYHFLRRRLFPSREHRGLKRWTWTREPLAIAIPDGLDDEVNVNWCPASVGPQADVSLIGSGELFHTGGNLAQERPEFPCLLFSQVGKMDAMAERLNDQCANAEWSDAMLDRPARGLVNSSAGERIRLCDQLTGKTGVGSHRTFSAV